MIVSYTDAVIDYLEELVQTLYLQNYFGLKEFAKKYVDKLIDEMEATIHIKPRRDASPNFNQYGQDLYYVSHRKNKHTTWYFFFTYHPTDDIYYIRYITNNHVAGHLI
ncbi:MAG: hypothetical protein LUH22_00340 [Bacteroides sp.]|nr:hypothetical protein [Bacteroides sp.]